MGQPVDPVDLTKEEDEDLCQALYENCLAEFHYVDAMNIDPSEFTYPEDLINNGSITLRNIIFFWLT